MQAFVSSSEGTTPLLIGSRGAKDALNAGILFIVNIIIPSIRTVITAFLVAEEIPSGGALFAAFASEESLKLI